MHTWSIAGVADRVWDFLSGVERVTRPPRLGHDGDHYDPIHARIDGAEQLAEFASCGRDMESYAEGFNEGYDEANRQQDPDWQPDDEVPNPYEPQLSDDELVAVRQMLEERFGDQISGGKPDSAEARDHSPRSPSAESPPPNGLSGGPW